MIAGMSNAEYDRRRQISVRMQTNGPRRTSLSEIMALGQKSSPSFAKRHDFRKLALKNTNDSVPVFKVSVAEIYESCNVKPVSFNTNKNQPSLYGRKRVDVPTRPAVRPRYVAIHSPPV